MKKLYLLLIALLLIMPLTSTMAQDGEDAAGSSEVPAEAAEDENQSRQEQQDAILERLRNNNPYLEKLRKASIEFIKGVPEEGVRPLYMIRESYGIIHSIYSVKKDIGNAVDQCAEANPDMADDMSSRFAEWSDKVTPALEEQDEKLQTAIQKQAYKKPEDINEYLKLIDDAAAYADEMLDKQVVTSEEACMSLKDSMDRTSHNIVDLLGKTPIPEFAADGTVLENETEKGEAGIADDADETESE